MITLRHVKIRYFLEFLISETTMLSQQLFDFVMVSGGFQKVKAEDLVNFLEGNLQIRFEDDERRAWKEKLGFFLVKGTVPARKRSSNLLKRLRKIFAMPVRPRSATEIRYNIIFPP